MLTEFFQEINWLSILTAGAAYFALGALWYSILFQKKWIEYSGINMDHPNAKKGVVTIMFISFIMMLITAVGLAILAQYASLKGWESGIKLGVLTGVCFALTSIAINMLYEKKPIGLYYINGGYQLLGNIIAAAIICGWRN